MNKGQYKQYRKELIDAVYKRDNYTCVYCLAPASTVDHVVPLSRGGKWRLNNLVACCIWCNNEKSDNSLKGFINDKLPYFRARNSTSDITAVELIDRVTFRLELIKDHENITF